MNQKLRPNPANGPLRPGSPLDNRGELYKLAHKLIDRMSEESLVVTAVLRFTLVTQLQVDGGVLVDLLALLALGTYLTLRLVGIFVQRR